MLVVSTYCFRGFVRLFRECKLTGFEDLMIGALVVDILQFTVVFVHYRSSKCGLVVAVVVVVSC